MKISSQNRAYYFIQDFFRLVFCSILFLSFNLYANEQKTRISVLYPESSKSSEALYQTIIKGMKTDQSSTLLIHQFKTKQNIQSIEVLVNNDNSQLLVLLGTAGANLSKKLSLNIPIVTGAHMLMQNNQSGISLSADPQQLFSALTKIRPSIKKINVIYNQKNNGWLIEKAKNAAEIFNLEVVAIPSEKIKYSAKELKKITANINPKTEAIWLPYDPIVPTKHLLPDLLKNAWNKNLIIFSGNPYHVQQGTLFALFPDYTRLGKQLIDLCYKGIAKQDTKTPQASIYLNSAINIRTASHLGIHLSNDEKENYQMIFPKN